MFLYFNITILYKMTCFWDGLLKGLHEKDYKQFDLKKINKIKLILLLKKHNKKTDDVLWNTNKLSEKELKENFKAVRDYNEKNNIQNGHLCSTCDYMLALICSLFNINIYHRYLQKQ